MYPLRSNVVSKLTEFGIIILICGLVSLAFYNSMIQAELKELEENLSKLKENQ